MKITFSSIIHKGILEDDFAHLSERNGTIEFKHMQGSGGIATIYAPNGTGKTTITNLLSMETSEGSKSFLAADKHGNVITPESRSFHVIPDQLNRNVIHGKTTDYLIGQQIRREYELRDRINSLFENAYNQLVSKYKTEFKVSKVGHYLLIQIKSLNGIMQQATLFIRSIVNVKQKVTDIDKNAFVAFIRNDNNRQTVIEMDNEKRSFVIEDLAKSNLIEKIISINPDEIIADKNTVLIERHDDAIGILKKYHTLDTCIVCDNHSFDGNALLERKTISRKNIYDSLDTKTKEILNKIICDNSLISSDPFEIKRIVGAFIADGDSTELIRLQHNLKTYVDNIGKEMVNALLHCFDNTSFFSDFDEHAQLVERQPKFDSEELLFIENVINENIDRKDITIVRDEDNDKNYKMKIGDKDLLETDRKDMELSTGEQNFISLAFELLLARHSDKEYVVIDDPISSFDSVYKNKIAYCIVKFLENKEVIIFTHNTDLLRLLDVQLNNCFNLYILNNVHDGTNGFIPVSEREKKLLINLHDLISLFQNKNDELKDALHDRRQFLMAMVPFMRGYAHINLDPTDRYGQLSAIMHGYGTESLDVIPIYNSLFGEVFEGTELISVIDVLNMDFSNLNILDKTRFPLLSDTLEQTLVYYHLRMKVEKELVDVFDLHVDDMTMLNQIIQLAFKCPDTDPNYERMREFRVFFTSRKTLLNEFNHFEGNINIFQPAIDITRSALQAEAKKIEAKLIEIRAFKTMQGRELSD